jgi:hypothetical protein
LRAAWKRSINGQTFAGAALSTVAFFAPGTPWTGLAGLAATATNAKYKTDRENEEVKALETKRRGDLENCTPGECAKAFLEARTANGGAYTKHFRNGRDWVDPILERIDRENVQHATAIVFAPKPPGMK